MRALLMLIFLAIFSTSANAENVQSPKGACVTRDRILSVNMRDGVRFEELHGDAVKAFIFAATEGEVSDGAGLDAIIVFAHPDIATGFVAAFQGGCVVLTFEVPREFAETWRGQST